MVRHLKGKIDMSNLTFVPLTRVPERIVYTPWPDLFGKIPVGQALVVREDELNPDSTRAALKRLQQN